jgi:hypothetical protein
LDRALEQDAGTSHYPSDVFRETPGHGSVGNVVQTAGLYQVAHAPVVVLQGASRPRIYYQHAEEKMSFAKKRSGMKLSRNKKNIIKLMQHTPNDSVSAAEIGQKCRGKSSHWANGHMPELVSLGLISYAEKGSFTLTDLGKKVKA